MEETSGWIHIHPVYNHAYDMPCYVLLFLTLCMLSIMNVVVHPLAMYWCKLNNSIHNIICITPSICICVIFFQMYTSLVFVVNNFFFCMISSIKVVFVLYFLLDNNGFHLHSLWSWWSSLSSLCSHYRIHCTRKFLLGGSN